MIWRRFVGTLRVTHRAELHVFVGEQTGGSKSRQRIIAMPCADGINTKS